ncbi:MAG: type II methionyl aminopeptidase [Nitrososphaerota archaeon]|nr:type II methionyl aminopeptidase [Nitrososphaerota archaeon]
MNEDEVKKYLVAGDIAKRVKKDSRKWIREGNSLLDLCEKIEKRIEELGGALAFPCNICVDEIAAHFTPPPDFNGKIPQEGLVKVDFGIHVDGYIVDTAFTIPLSTKDREMVEVVEESLSKASEILKAGIKISQVGEMVEKFARSKGFKVIRNLTGHQIDRFNLHTGLSIPNIRILSTERFKKDMVVAIEPFITTIDGAGEVGEIEETYIYRFKYLSMNYTGEFGDFLRKLHNSFKTLPFCERWIINQFGEAIRDSAKKTLEYYRKNLMFYPVLVEKNRKKVAQVEDTFLVLEDSAINLTSEEA